MLFHTQIGDSGPAVIGLHGLATAHRLLSAQLAPLADSARLFFPDLLGHGKSPWPDCTYEIRDHLDALHAWRWQSGLVNEPVYLVGVSLGAILALHYAAYEQAWYGGATVQGVVPISTPAFPSPATGRAVVGRAMPMAWLITRQPRMSARLCGMLCGVGGLGWTYGPKLARWLSEEIIQDTFAHDWQSLSLTLDRIVLDPQLPKPLAALGDVPLLFIHGDQDRLAPLRFLQANLAGHPRARLLVLPGAGHDALVSRTPAILTALRANISTPSPRESAASAILTQG